MHAFRIKCTQAGHAALSAEDQEEAEEEDQEEGEEGEEEEILEGEEEEQEMGVEHWDEVDSGLRVAIASLPLSSTKCNLRRGHRCCRTPAKPGSHIIHGWVM